MRTTVTLDPEASAAVARYWREHHVGVSEAVSELIRRGVSVPSPSRQRFVQRTAPGDALFDPRNIGEVLEMLDGETSS